MQRLVHCAAITNTAEDAAVLLENRTPEISPAVPKDADIEAFPQAKPHKKPQTQPYIGPLVFANDIVIIPAAISEKEMPNGSKRESASTRITQKANTERVYVLAVRYFFSFPKSADRRYDAHMPTTAKARLARSRPTLKYPIVIRTIDKKRNAAAEKAVRTFLDCLKVPLEKARLTTKTSALATN